MFCSPFSDYPLFLFLTFSITSLAFLWYRSPKYPEARSNHSTPHPDKGRSDAIHDMFSVPKKPTTTSTTVATTYNTPSTVPRADAARIPPRNEELPQPSMEEQCQTTWTCQPYDAFLVLDVEATCLQGTDFHWPNEIIVSYRVEMRLCRSVEYRNGQFVFLSGRTGRPVGWSGPCRKLQNFAALLNQHGAPSYPPFASPSLAFLKLVLPTIIKSFTHLENRMYMYLGTGRWRTPLPRSRKSILGLPRTPWSHPSSNRRASHAVLLVYRWSV